MAGRSCCLSVGHCENKQERKGLSQLPDKYVTSHPCNSPNNFTTPSTNIISTQVLNGLNSLATPNTTHSSEQHHHLGPFLSTPVLTVEAPDNSSIGASCQCSDPSTGIEPGSIAHRLEKPSAMSCCGSYRIPSGIVPCREGSSHFQEQHQQPHSSELDISEKSEPDKFDDGSRGCYGCKPKKTFGAIKQSCCGVKDKKPCLQSSHILPDLPSTYGLVPNFERVILTIEGLKCGCCEHGISRALGHISAIRNHQVNVVLARVEFELDVNQYSVQEVMKKLSGATGYTFKELIQSDGQAFEILVNDPSEILQTVRPYGVGLLDTGDKKVWAPYRIFSGQSSAIPPAACTVPPARNNTPVMSIQEEKPTPRSFCQRIVRIHYDARFIGARDLFDYYRRVAPCQDVQLAPPSAPSSLAISAKQTQRACMMFILALVFTVPVLIFAWGPVGHEKFIFTHLSLAFASVVQVIAIWEFVPGALRSLIHSGLLEMDLLVALSTTIAYVFSIVSYVFQLRRRPLETGTFFETSTLLVTLILLGRLISEAARLRAAESVSFRSLQAREAMIIEGEVQPTVSPSRTRKIDARLLQHGDHFVVWPHTRIVTDGKVISGGSEVDESMITGEPLPVAKGQGSEVYAGTNNKDGTLIVALTAVPHENSVSRIASLVENAELTKPKAQALADRIASWFVPTIAAIGLMVFLAWLFVDRYQLHRSWKDAVVKAITYAIATLIVSCPCAIGLAVPMVILITGGVSARFGIIFRDPTKLEISRKVTDIVFDKTGTITTGILAVKMVEFHHAGTDEPGTSEGTVVVKPFNSTAAMELHTGHENAGDTKDVKEILLGLLGGIRHPVASAVYEWTKEQDIDKLGAPLTPAPISNISSFPGQGVKGTCMVTGKEILAGSTQFVGMKDVFGSSHTLLCVTIGGKPSATFRLEDQVRDMALTTMKCLRNRRIEIHMTTGDNDGAAQTAAFAVGIAKANVQSHLRPEDKQAYVKTLQQQGKTVMFVGDGTNDAVALKQADVGVHLNHGSEIAKSSADVVLMNPELLDLIVLFDISRAAYRRIVANFAWSAIYNIIAILMAAGAFVKVRIAPEYAGLGELVSVLPVVFIAFQMNWRNYGQVEGRKRGIRVRWEWLSRWLKR